MKISKANILINLLPRFTIFLLILILPIASIAENPNDETVFMFQTEDEFDYVVENINDAILARGMVVSNVVTLGDMLKRTGEDLGFPDPIYKNAKTIGFCNALLSHKLAQLDPRNVTSCPFAISIYETSKQQGTVHIIFRKYKIFEDNSKLSSSILELLNDIVNEALTF